jgi:hypothetical protein
MFEEYPIETKVTMTGYRHVSNKTMKQGMCPVSLANADGCKAANLPQSSRAFARCFNFASHVLPVAILSKSD